MKDASIAKGQVISPENVQRMEGTQGGGDLTVTTEEAGKDLTGEEMIDMTGQIGSYIIYPDVKETGIIVTTTDMNAMIVVIRIVTETMTVKKIVIDMKNANVVKDQIQIRNRNPLLKVTIVVTVEVNKQNQK